MVCLRRCNGFWQRGEGARWAWRARQFADYLLRMGDKQLQQFPGGWFVQCLWVVAQTQVDGVAGVDEQARRLANGIAPALVLYGTESGCLGHVAVAIECVFNHQQGVKKLAKAVVGFQAVESDWALGLPLQLPRLQ